MLLVLIPLSATCRFRKLMQILLLAFLIIPFIEIYVLLQVGGLIGAFPTISLVVLTAIAGAWLLRRQGFATWQRIQQTLQRGEIPAQEMIEGPILLIGAALLLTPGFFTDLLGFVCLIPALRSRIARYVLEKNLLNTIRPAGKASTDEQVIIEGEYKKQNENLDQ